MYSEVDLNKYYSLKEIEGYELFIGPEGEYYKVKKINENSTISHSVWAAEYFKKNNFKFLTSNVLEKITEYPLLSSSTLIKHIFSNSLTLRSYNIKKSIDIMFFLSKEILATPLCSSFG